MFGCFFNSINAVAALNFAKGQEGRQVQSIGGTLKISGACSNKEKEGYYDKLCLNGKETGIEESQLVIVDKYSINGSDIFLIQGCGGNSCVRTVYLIKIQPNGSWVTPVRNGIDIGSGSDPFDYKVSVNGNGLVFSVKDSELKKWKIYIYEDNIIREVPVSNSVELNVLAAPDNPKDRVAAQVLSSCNPSRQLTPGAIATGCSLWPTDLAEKSKMFREAWRDFERALPGLKETEKILPRDQRLVIQPLSPVTVGKKFFLSVWQQNSTKSIVVFSLYSPETGKMVGIYRNKFVFKSDNFYRVAEITDEQLLVIGVPAHHFPDEFKR
jgi:hypothetical protein